MAAPPDAITRASSRPALASASRAAARPVEIVGQPRAQRGARGQRLARRRQLFEGGPRHRIRQRSSTRHRVERRRRQHRGQLQPLGGAEAALDQRAAQLACAIGRTDLAGPGTGQRQHRQPADQDLDRGASRGVGLGQAAACRQSRQQAGQRLRRLLNPALGHGRVEAGRRGGGAGRGGELVAQLERGGEAVRRPLGQGPAQHLFERGHHRRLGGTGDLERGRRILGVGAGDLGGRGPRERRVTGQGEVEQRAQGVDVGAAVHRGRRGPLLGCHVARRAQELVVAGELDGADLDDADLAAPRILARDRVAGVGSAAVGQRLGHAEVEQLGQEPAGRRHHHDVRWLEVAVHDAELVGGVDHLAQRRGQGREVLERHGAAVNHQPPERPPAHQLHGQPQEPVGLGAERVDVGGVGVVEARGQARLAQEPLGPGPGEGAVAPHHLDHRVATQELLLGPVDLAQTAAADVLDHAEAAQQPAEQLGAGVVERVGLGSGQAAVTRRGRTQRRAGGGPAPAGVGWSRRARRVIQRGGVDLGGSGRAVVGRRQSRGRSGSHPSGHVCHAVTFLRLATTGIYLRDGVF